jgi:hypothetical protein
MKYYSYPNFEILFRSMSACVGSQCHDKKLHLKIAVIAPSQFAESNTDSEFGQTKVDIGVGKGSSSSTCRFTE